MIRYRRRPPVPAHIKRALPDENSSLKSSAARSIAAISTSPTAATARE